MSKGLHRPPYNTDVDVGEEYFDTRQRLGVALRWPVLIETFKRFDGAATRYKSAFQTLGQLSLFLGAIALTGISWELLVAESGEHVYEITAVIEALAIVSIVLAWFSRRFRSLFRLNCYAREAIRLWRFQLFLDGALVVRLCREEPDALDELDKRWQAFLATVSTPGSVTAYIASPAAMYHPSTPYSDDEISADVFDALSTIRFRHQINFAMHRVDRNPVGRVSLQELNIWSEAVARLSLFAALTIPILHLLFLAVGVIDESALGSGIHGYMLWAAIVATILSLAARTYRAGMTLPEEIESYLLYKEQLAPIVTQFDEARTQEQRAVLLQELEVFADTELKQYLRMKSNATFLF